MSQKRSIFYNALLLTAVHLLLRFAGTSFQVYLSGRIGAAGIGLLQLTLSVGSLAMVAGIAGIRTASMYLTADTLGRKQEGCIQHVLSVCIRYCILTSVTVAALLALLAPRIARQWIADASLVPALRLLAGFLPVSCLVGVLVGYFTAEGRIAMLAAVEVAEQLFSMGTTILALRFWAGSDSVRACESVIAGSGVGSCFTLITLCILRLREPNTDIRYTPVWKKLSGIAIPLALADLLKAGISTTENLMVPKRLALYTFTQDPLADFGVMSGMVFPVMMFPACILFGLADLLIPELARCAAGVQKRRIAYLVKKTLKIGVLYGLFFGGGLHILAKPLCSRLYANWEAGVWLSRYALLVPMLYCDILVDAMTKGLGQQRACVQYNIITSAMDVVFLFILLPLYGMKGYYLSFLITHLVNFMLSLRRLLRISHVKLPFAKPVLCFCAAAISLAVSNLLPRPADKLAAYLLLLGSSLSLCGIVTFQDIRWLCRVVSRKRRKHAA